jgi:hypothetical protein
MSVGRRASLVALGSLASALLWADLHLPPPVALVDRLLEVGPGVLAFVLGPALAGWIASERDLVRAGAALGLSLTTSWELHRLGPTVAVHALLWLGLALLAWRAVRSSAEPAARRVVLTAAIGAPLVLLGLATMLSWPTDGHGELRILGTPQVALATACFTIAYVDLAARRSRALLVLLTGAIALCASPHLGAWSGGCWVNPGPLERLVFPRVLPFVALGLWAGPVWRWLAGARTHRADQSVLTCSQAVR